MVTCERREQEIVDGLVKMTSNLNGALMLVGGDGIVQTWDLRTRQCMSRFVDEGNMRASAIATSRGQRWLATGSEAGFVNIYNQQRATEASHCCSRLCYDA